MKVAHLTEARLNVRHMDFHVVLETTCKRKKRFSLTGKWKKPCLHDKKKLLYAVSPHPETRNINLHTTTWNCFYFSLYTRLSLLVYDQDVILGLPHVIWVYSVFYVCYSVR